MITLVLGGARSGKSDIAEARASRLSSRVSYLATGRLEGADPAWRERIARHRERRSAEWVTLEVGDDLTSVLRQVEGVALLDALSTWLAARPDFAYDESDLLEALRTSRAELVIVSDEVGWGVHPASEVGRDFRDALGTLNRRVAAVADVVVLVVAGIELVLKAPAHS